jgi:hypothetical protein
VFCPELHGRRARPTPERTHKRCRFRVTGSCTDSGQIHVVARAVFLPLESNFDPLGRWVLPKQENASASLFLTPTMPPHQKLPWQPVPPAVRRGRPCRSRRCRTWRESEGPSRGGSLMSQSKHARVRPAAAPRRAFAILGQEELPSIVGRTHTGRTCCDNDLLKSSDPSSCPLPHTGRGSLLGAIGVYAPNFSWKKLRIAAHERLSVFSL